MFNKKPSGLIFEERIKRLFHSLGFKIISVEEFIGPSVRFRKFVPDFFIKGTKPPFEILALIEWKYYKGKVPAEVILKIVDVLKLYPEADKAVVVSSFGFTEEAYEIASSSRNRHRLLLTTEAELIEKLPEHLRRDFMMEYANSALPSEKLETYFVADKYQGNIRRLLAGVPKERLEAILVEHVGDERLFQNFSALFGRETVRNIISKSSVREISDFVLKQQERIAQTIRPEKNRLEKIYEESKSQNDPNAKGKLLEDVVEGLFGLVDGLRVHKRNVRTDKEEIDLLVRNQSKEEPWKNLGPMIFVECKNWTQAVGSSEISIFRTKLGDHRVDTGIFVTINGITGKGSFQAARAQIRDAWKFDHRKIFVLEGKDIDSILKCTRLTDIMEERFCEFWEM